MDREPECPDTPCSRWEMYIAPDGYGRKGVTLPNGKRSTKTAHRWVWEQAHGPLPKSTDVMHLCHNRACVNLDHLRPGSRGENLKMAGRRGRLAHPMPGESNGSSKLTEDDVRAIRASSETQTALARQYGVRQTTISMIVRRETWRHI